MTDLKVNGDVLQASARALEQLKAEFDGIETRRDDTRDLWGHEGVRDAMHEFASNMDYHRRKLSEEIQACGEKTAATLEAFDATETELANSFEVQR